MSKSNIEMMGGSAAAVEEDKKRQKERQLDEAIEYAYWHFDGLHRTGMMAMSERDAFKAALRRFLKTAKEYDLV